MKHNIILTKPGKTVNGTVQLTGSKSECNRALVIEALSGGKVKVEIPIFLITENSYSFNLPPRLTGNGTGYYFKYPPADLDAPFHPPALA